MSIANLIVQPDAAYLITDAGMFGEDGTITALSPKTFLAHKNSFAYACVGNCAGLVFVARRVMSRRIATGSFGPEDFMAFIRECYDAAGADPTAQWSRWVAAGWSREHDCPIGLAFFTSDQDAAATGDEPWAWREFSSLMQPHVSAEELGTLGFARHDLVDPARFQPERDSMALVDLVRQRRTGWGCESAPSEGCFVAGKITLTRVSRRGVETALLHEYPDRVGECAGVRDK